MIGPQPNPASDQFAAFATKARKIATFIQKNPDDLTARKDLAYLTKMMQSNAQDANATDMQQAPGQVNPGEAMAMQMWNGLGGTPGLSPIYRQGARAPMDQTLQAAQEQNPTASMVGKGAAIAGTFAVGDMAGGWPVLKAIASVPRFTRLGLLKMLGGVASSTPELIGPVAEAAEAAAAKAGSEVAGEVGNAASKAKFAMPRQGEFPPIGGRTGLADEAMPASMSPTQQAQYARNYQQKFAEELEKRGLDPKLAKAPVPEQPLAAGSSAAMRSGEAARDAAERNLQNMIDNAVAASKRAGMPEVPSSMQNWSGKFSDNVETALQQVEEAPTSYLTDKAWMWRKNPKSMASRLAQATIKELASRGVKM